MHVRLMLKVSIAFMKFLIEIPGVLNNTACWHKLVSAKWQNL